MGDEPELRASWGRHLEFIVTCIGFAVGLGNVWRFPYLCYRNGGGAFLIPYIISLVFMGIPLFCLEVTFGQFASLGPLSIWTINPLFKGLGYTMMALVSILTIYYNVVVAQAVFFLFASMQNPLPWTQCGQDWNTCYCRTGDENGTDLDPMRWFNSTGLNCTGVEVTNEDIKSASEEYYNHYVLDITSGIDEPGRLKWDMTLCNLGAWVIICVSLIKGVSSLGKTQYFFALFPYVILTILLVRGVTLDGSSDGIHFYLSPDVSKLSESSVWLDAASQIFFSLSTSTGSLTAMASYTKFKNNSLRDSIIIPIINCLTSFYAGFAIFSILGFMAYSKGVEVSDVTTSGTGLVFKAYPEALARMPVPQLWSILFFFMMICLGMGTQIPSAETLLTALQDEYAFLRGKWRSVIFRVSMCCLGFLLGLPQTTQGGTYLLDLLDIFVGFPLLLVGLFEFIAIVWVYGFGRITEDVMMMMGDSPITRMLYYCYFSWTWLIVGPGLLIAIIVFDSINYEPITGPGYPEWSETLGWLVVAFIMMWIPVWFIIMYCYKGGFKLLRQLNQPLPEWGPALPEHRTIPRYQLIPPFTPSAPYSHPPDAIADPHAVEMTAPTEQQQEGGEGRDRPPSYKAELTKKEQEAGGVDNRSFQDCDERTHL
ncbi:sodium- and chloride-dependent glycine transporter 1-like [Babylonia areolata]|uniref:sodium- and chloride-dependent glycine transporter 1-like n=1 Tax=Babylonia areolata TaxID=304850 RepID=UPI003FD0BF36